ncbi:DNA pilot protein [Dipodfec virus RodF1_80]|uniref:DNA pilot protein n=1 Tax=Dipodfec virus RodF1_80 TaxID=2929312 RepID=A0A976N359_9VIRU|nr:DNA pilot protein [Dipodfec virus RodF1_80]
MLPLIAGAAAAVIGNLIATSVNNKNQQNASTLNYKRQIDFWNMQNEYNTPAAQMERYRAAGLNPNLIYGTGTSSAGNASGSVSPQMPNLQPYRFDALANIGPLLLQQKSVDADVRNKDALSRYNEVKAQSEYLTMLGKEYDNALKSEDYGRAVRLRELRDETERKTYELLSHNSDYAAAHAQNEENQDVLFQLTLDKQVKRATVDLQNAVKDGQLKDVTKSKILADISEINKRVALLQYEIDINPDAKKTKEYNDEVQEIDLAIQRLDEENAERFKESNAWADAVSRWTGVIGSALGGYTGVQNARTNRMNAYTNRFKLWK